MADIAGQNVAHALADIVYDPFVTQEKAEIQRAFGESELTVHYQAPLTDGDDVYMMTKMGSCTPCVPAGNWAATNAHCGPNAWESMIWCETRFTWMPNGKLVEVWDFASDWKPEPNGGGSGLAGWEPVFHVVDANNFIYVPGASGTIWKVNKADGSVPSHVNPFSGGNITPADTYVAGPLSADSQGNIYYNVIELTDPSAGNPWTHHIQGAWLVKVTPSDQSSSVSYAALLAGSGAPPGNATNCPGTFGAENPPPAPPWPPSTTAVPTTHVCGSQRPGLNIARAISADGSKIYTASTAHLDAMQSYLVAVKSDLSGASWVAPLQNLLSDGCGFLVPIATPTNPNMPNVCRVGSTPGVDPTTSAKGSGLILDQASSSTTVLPDVSVLFGPSTNYNGQRGHLFKFDATGAFVAAYDFGWDTTPTVYTHNGTYSVVLKDNHYPVPLHCNVSGPACASLPAGPYFITQLNPSLNIECNSKIRRVKTAGAASSSASTCRPWT